MRGLAYEQQANRASLFFNLLYQGVRQISGVKPPGGRQSLRAALALTRYFQNSSKRRLLFMHRSARMFSAPDSDRNMPDCLQRAPMTVLQPSSTTPEPMKTAFIYTANI